MLYLPEHGPKGFNPANAPGFFFAGFARYSRDSLRAGEFGGDAWLDCSYALRG
jgi:hypothetical protein